MVDQDSEHNDAEWQSDQASIARSFSSLLQQAWQMPMESIVSALVSWSLKSISEDFWLKKCLYYYYLFIFNLS